MTTKHLTAKQIAFYRENGYLHIPKVFTLAETNELAAELDWMIEKWALPDASWTGPWRKVYMDADTEKKSKLVGMHDLQLGYRNVENAQIAGQSMGRPGLMVAGRRPRKPGQELFTTG